MKKLTEEMLGWSGWSDSHFDRCDFWNSGTLRGARLCFDNSKPRSNFVSWEVCRKAYSEINLIIFNKTNNRNITENYEKNN